MRAPPASGGGSALDLCCGGEGVASFLLSVVCCDSGILWVVAVALVCAGAALDGVGAA